MVGLCDANTFLKNRESERESSKRLWNMLPNHDHYEGGQDNHVQYFFSIITGCHQQTGLSVSFALRNVEGFGCSSMLFSCREDTQRRHYGCLQICCIALFGKELLKIK